MLRALSKANVVPGDDDHTNNQNENENENYNSAETRRTTGGRIIPSRNWDSFVEIDEEPPSTSCSAADKKKKRSQNMGNTPSSAASAVSSCASGFESSKSGMLTTRTFSHEELERYAMTQELLEQAKSHEEASQVSSHGHCHSLSHADSMERLDELMNDPITGSRPLVRTSSSTSSGGRRSFRGFRKNSHKMFDKIANAFTAVGKELFPHTPQVGSSSIRSKAPAVSVIPKVRGGVLLRGCTDDEEHKQVVRQSIAIMRELKGEEGLKAMGFEFRAVPLDNNEDENTSLVEKNNNTQSEVPGLMDADEDETMTTTTETTEEPLSRNESSSEEESSSLDPLSTMQRLLHAESNTLITMKNRKEFVADGDMYDHVARLCQEYAQTVMIQEGDLEWVTVCEAGNNAEPIRALVSSALSKDEASLDKVPTLLIATGKGKVRAGIFSRQHLLMSGMECSTALPIVREARKRNMNVVMVDPNVHGDRLGMVTFEKSMARIFRRWESEEEVISSSDHPPLANRDLFVLSHSQSGAQFARYLLEKSNHYVPHIRAVAFTDSTHNIQWARENKDLHQLLQSDNCVYFKCSKDSPKEVLAPLETTGEDVETDHFWEHRFGTIKTKCAGTTEHSLTNWFVHSHIWDHFDQFLHGQQPKGEEGKSPNPVQSQ
jgi:hypothetical protein